MSDQASGMRGGDFPESSQGARSNVSHPTSGPSDMDPRKAQGSMSQSKDSRTSYLPSQSFHSQQHVPQQRPDAFMLPGLAGALPDISHHNYGNFPQQGQIPNQSPSGLVYPMQNMTQFVGSPIPNQPNVAYAALYQGQLQGIYPTDQTPSTQQLQPAAAGGQNFQGGYIAQHQQPSSQYFLQPHQYGSQDQIYSGNSTTAQDRMRNDFSRESRQQPGSEYMRASPSSSGPARSGSIASSPGKSSVVRGPPRKPRQSGHAIWIGNLPPQTDLMNLVFHVCKETPELESLFLISKSNCAFANFRDEAACIAAQAKIHDSRFQSVRLVSRLRRGSVGAVAGLAAPSGPAALTPPNNPVVARTPSPEDETTLKEPSLEVDGEKSGTGEGSLAKDRFFIVKSLTVEDLELSVRNGIWATQSHNEETLNKAYQAAENVYLIFSANKSGEYFGYARMTSLINDDPDAAIEFAPKPQSVEDPDLPKAIPTPATEFAPKGRIIDDSARGTIFWEVERDEDEEEGADNRSDHGDLEAPASKSWGKPFKIEWMSTTRLPFYRTRGLRNPWNSNREVKIARDGTELETSVGRGLLGLFHLMPSPAVPQMQATSVPMMGGLPHMQNF
ncbi:RNA-binding, RBD [Venustampulla echinocandica]|uniref:RNA-binding, RBD n=1 Tax=Venustampulla echinocandica TaxID=2656787 RepID=A0A370THE3_9HELO|nr:RNA-binding, RBD [Venustampulla echinocandica]RDL34613.1 RNA-binding, RBD [Venustampulla echinocandica]